MSKRSARSILVAAVSATAVLAAMPAATAAAMPTPPPTTRIVAHFDIGTFQTPENLASAPDGSVIVSFAAANQVARVSPNGAVNVVAQLPAGGQCAGFTFPVSLGVARAHDGTVYVNECSGNANTGVWRLRPGAAPEQIAQLPAGGQPNGLAIDDRTGNLYVTDSVGGAVWRVPTRGGAPAVWATGPEFQRVSLAGANGLVLHEGAVWVGNLDKGLVLRIPVRHDGTAGPVRTVLTGLNGIDDFSVVGRDTVVGALIARSQVVEARPGRQPRVLLTAADGLSNPTSVRFRGDTMYVTSAAYYTLTDPNLLVTHFGR